MATTEVKVIELKSQAVIYDATQVKNIDKTLQERKQFVTHLAKKSERFETQLAKQENSLRHS